HALQCATRPKQAVISSSLLRPWGAGGRGKGAQSRRHPAPICFIIVSGVPPTPLDPRENARPRSRSLSPGAFLYASRPLSPVAAQHSLPSGRYSLTWAGLPPASNERDLAMLATQT